MISAIMLFTMRQTNPRPSTTPTPFLPRSERTT